MVNFSNEYYTMDINFALSRAVLKESAVELVPRDKEGFRSKAYRFFTFQNDPRLLEVNKKLTGGSGLVEEIAKEIFRQDVTARESQKNHIITNLNQLNEKFIKGNQRNFLASVALRIINFIRGLFGKEKIGYKELDLKKIENDLVLKLTQLVNASQPGPGAIVPFYQMKLPVPLPIVPLFGSQSQSLTVSQVWTLMPGTTQQAVTKLFETGELTLHNHVISVIGQNSSSEISLDAQGDVSLTLEEEDLKVLQLALTGEVTPQSRLLACMVLIRSGQKALPLLTALQDHDIQTIEGIARLLLEGPTSASGEKKSGGSTEIPDVESKPKPVVEKPKTLLDRITDAANPPILKVDQNPFTVRLDTKKKRFIIENRSDKPMYFTAEGIMYKGRYCRYLDAATRPPFVVVKNDDHAPNGSLISVEVLENCYYKVSYGGQSFLIISREDLSKMQ